MGHKEIRKIIRQGNSSLAVILPKPWLDYYGIKYGDEVEVISEDCVKIIPIKKGGMCK